MFDELTSYFLIVLLSELWNQIHRLPFFRQSIYQFEKNAKLAYLQRRCVQNVRQPFSRSVIVTTLCIQQSLWVDVIACAGRLDGSYCRSDIMVENEVWFMIVGFRVEPLHATA